MMNMRFARSMRVASSSSRWVNCGSSDGTHLARRVWPYFNDSGSHSNNDGHRLMNTLFVKKYRCSSTHTLDRRSAVIICCPVNICTRPTTAVTYPQAVCYTAHELTSWSNSSHNTACTRSASLCSGMRRSKNWLGVSTHCCNNGSSGRTNTRCRNDPATTT